jgi:hypothetical protein
MTTIVVTNGNDSGAGSLRAALASASAGDTIVFAADVTTIDLTSGSLVVATDVTIEGSQPGTSTPGVTIVGGGIASNFSVFKIDANVSATIDGLIIEDGHATGTTGSFIGATGGAAAGGIFDAGALTLTDSVLVGDTAVGGTGGSTSAASPDGGGAGGEAAGAIYVAATGSLNLAASDSFIADSAEGGTGGKGGSTPGGVGGAGGAGGSAVNGASAIGSPGTTGGGTTGGTGGAPGQKGGNTEIGGAGGGGGGTAFGDVGGPGTITGPVPCYCPGTLIRTARGEEPVEKLKIGDKVTTASGMTRPIKWIGRRSYGGRFIRGDKDMLPVCIKAGALEENVPRRDLWVSPHHAMYLGGVLIEAKDLVNGFSIVQAERAERIDYYHVELDTHDVIIAEGALSETYLDDDNRLMFHNARDYYARYSDVAAAPSPYCAPRLEDGYEVEAARQRIAARSGLSVYRKARVAAR